MTTTSPRTPRLVRLLSLAVLLAFPLLWGWGAYNIVTDPPADPQLPLILAAALAAYLGLYLPLWQFVTLVGVTFAAILALPDRAADSLMYGVTVGVVLAVSFVFVRGVRRAAAEVDAEDELPPVISSGNFVQGVLADTTETAPSPRIIGLCGYARAGKDTAAKALLWEGWAHASFAAKLKTFTAKANPLISVHPGMPGYTQLAAREDADITGNGLVYVRYAEYLDLVGETDAKINPEVRALQQRVGTDAGRKVLGEDVWVDAALADLPAKDVVFTDVRFPNEAAAIQDAGGYIIRVNRPGYGPVNDHPSETALDNFPVDAVIVNDGARGDLGTRLKVTLAQLEHYATHH